jgi:hypothetical protein
MRPRHIAWIVALAGCSTGAPEVARQASDTTNLCNSHTLPAGTPFSLPAADAPLQAGDPDNDMDEWFWTTRLHGLYSGKDYASESFIFRFRAFGQDVRWGQVSITDGSTGTYHQGQYLIPGLFAETTNSFDLDFGIPGAPRATGGGGGLPDGPADHVTASTFDGSRLDLYFSNLSNVMVQLGGGHASFTDPLSGTYIGQNYYYSRPTMAVAGTLTVDGFSEPVVGEGWFDREWRACCFGGYFHQPNPIFTQWHWAGFHLSDGSAWSYYRIFVQGHEEDGLMSDTANFLDAAPACRQGALGHGDFSLDHSGAWTSPHSGKTYPTQYHFVVPSEELDVWVTPKVQDQEATEVPLALGFQPWYEGWALIQGTHHGRPVHGDGYMELFGFP